MAQMMGSDYNCGKCGNRVVKAMSKAGKTYVANYEIWRGDQYNTTRWIPSGHQCFEADVVRYQERIAYALANGEIVKGQDVIVIRGRKVPKGTEGKVFWVGEKDFYGVQSVGIANGEDKWFVNIDYLQVKNVIVESEETYVVGCVYDCGEKTTFYDASEYEVYGDDWVCKPCVAKHAVVQLSCN